MILLEALYNRTSSFIFQKVSPPPNQTRVVAVVLFVALWQGYFARIVQKSDNINVRHTIVITCENARFLLLLLARTVMSKLAIIKVIGLLKLPISCLRKRFSPAMPHG